MHQTKDITAFKQLLLIAGLVVGGFLLAQIVCMISTIPFIGISGLSEIAENPANYTNIVKFLQIAQAICLFIIPAFFYCKLTGNSPTRYLKLNKSVPTQTGVLIVVIMIAAIPFINLLGDINSKMVLPAFLNNIEDWMETAEERAAKLTIVLVSGTTISSLLINLIMIAVLPAISEEVLFRGILQPILIKSTRNIHIAIIITAAIFSAFHLQFYGFLPRFFLGIILGYLYVASGSLWLPIIAHFTNNAIATICYYLVNNSLTTENLDTIGTGEGQMTGILSAGILLIIFFFLQRHKTTLQLDELK